MCFSVVFMSVVVSVECWPALYKSLYMPDCMHISVEMCDF